MTESDVSPDNYPKSDRLLVFLTRVIEPGSVHVSPKAVPLSKHDKNMTRIRLGVFSFIIFRYFPPVEVSE